MCYAILIGLSFITLWFFHPFQTSKLALHDIDSKKEELEVLEYEKLKEIDRESYEYEITVIEENIKNMKPNMGAILEYKKKVGYSSKCPRR